MNQDYSTGYDHGQEDGETGENRLAARSAKRLLSVGAYLPGAENRDDQYRKGYLAGFEDRVRTRRVVPAEPSTPAAHSTATHSTSTQGAAPMSNITSFAHQIELLQGLQYYLSEFQERLLGASAAYQRKVDALHAEGGLMDETYRDFNEQALAPTRALIERLVDHIEQSDIPAVRREITYLEQKL